MKFHDPHSQLIFLLSEVTWLVRRDFHARARQMKATQTQTKALLVIARREGLTQSSLAQRLEVQPMTVARMIDRMQRAGLVKRVPRPDDRRAVGLYLTPKARPVLQKVMTIAGAVRERAIAGLSNDDKTKLEMLLQKIKTNYACVDELAGEKQIPEGVK